MTETPVRNESGAPDQGGAPTENPAERYRRLADHFDKVVSAVPADRWDSPSPCDNWTVAQVVAHVTDTQLDFLGRQELPCGDELGEDAAPIERWRAARAAMQAAVDDASIAGRTYDGYFGPTTIGETIDTFYSMDLAVHGWDVARGAGLGDLEEIDDEDIARSRAQLAAVGDTVRMAGIFGEEVELPDGASNQDRFLAWTGRRP